MKDLPKIQPYVFTAEQARNATPDMYRVSEWLAKSVFTRIQKKAKSGSRDCIFRAQSQRAAIGIRGMLETYGYDTELEGTLGVKIKW